MPESLLSRPFIRQLLEQVLGSAPRGPSDLRGRAASLRALCKNPPQIPALGLMRGVTFAASLGMCLPMLLAIRLCGLLQ